MKVSTEASEIEWVRASSLFPNAQLVVDGSSKDDVNRPPNFTAPMSTSVVG